MSQKLQCEQCGGEDFNLEDGFYFCRECHMQSQNVQEQLMEDFVGIGSQRLATVKVSQPIEEVEAGEALGTGNPSSWEILNHILKGLVEELILLGAPKQLKSVCLQLWVTYLNKIEVAFTSTTVKKKPKLGAFPRKRDASLFYKVSYSLSTRHFRTSEKKRRYDKKGSPSDDSASHDTSVRSRKLRLTRSKKSVAQAEYDESGLDSSANTSLANDSDVSYGSSGEERQALGFMRCRQCLGKHITEGVNVTHYPEHVQCIIVLSLWCIIGSIVLGNKELRKSREMLNVDVRSHFLCNKKGERVVTGLLGVKTVGKFLWKGLRHSRQGKKELEEFLRICEVQEDKAKFHSKMVVKYSKSIQHTRLTHILVILRIGLLLCHCDVHLGDLKRWTDEGYLSLDKVQKLLPPTVIPSMGQSGLVTQIPNNFVNISRATRDMAKLLGVQKDLFSPSQIILKLVQRYCIMLLLPDRIATGVARLLQVKPPNLSILSPISNFEGRAMAFILFSLKILIGLDDVTEYHYVPRKEDGVKWDEWAKQREGRTAEKAINHYPTMQQHYSKSFVNRGHAFLSHWDTSTCFKRSYAHGKRQLFKDSLLKTLQPLACQLAEPSWRPGLNTCPEVTGPLLGVVNEAKENCFSEVQKKVTIVKPLAAPNLKRKKFNYRRNLKVKVLNDVAAVSSVTRERVKNELLNSFDADITTLDFKIWLFHSYHLTNGIHLTSLFDDVAAEILPNSFIWILREMADLIYQPPSAIYDELVRVEKIYICDKRRFHW